MRYDAEEGQWIYDDEEAEQDVSPYESYGTAEKEEEQNVYDPRQGKWVTQKEYDEYVEDSPEATEQASLEVSSIDEGIGAPPVETPLETPSEPSYDEFGGGAAEAVSAKPDITAGEQAWSMTDKAMEFFKDSGMSQIPAGLMSGANRLVEISAAGWGETLQELEDNTAEKLGIPPRDIKGQFDQVAKTYADEANFWGAKQKQWSNPEMNIDLFENPMDIFDPKKLNYFLGSQVAPMAIGGGASKLAKFGEVGQALTVGTVFSAPEALDTYQEVYEETGSREVAANVAGKQFVVTNALEAIGFNKAWLGTGTFFSRFLKGGANEAKTEALQTFYADVSKDATLAAHEGKNMAEVAEVLKENMPQYAKNFTNAGVMGFVAGGPTGVAGKLSKESERIIKEDRVPTAEEAQYIIDEIAGRRGGSEQESNDIRDFLIQQVSNKSAEESADVLKQGTDGDWERRVEKIYELRRLEETLIAPKSAKESAEVFESTPEIKSAEESAKVMEAEGPSQIEVLSGADEQYQDRAVKAGQAAVDTLKRTLPGPKSAEESAKAMEGEKHVVEAVVEGLEEREAKVAATPKGRVVKMSPRDKAETYVSPEAGPELVEGKQWEHKQSGAIIEKQDDGLFKAEGIEQPFTSVAKARRALDDIHEDYLTKPTEETAYETDEAGGAQAVATTASVEDTVSELEEEALLAGKPKEEESLLRDITEDTTTSLKGPDSTISPEEKLLTQNISDSLVAGILSNDTDSVTKILNRFPEGNRKTVLAKARKLAEIKAVETGDFDMDDVVAAGEEMAKEVAGTKTYAGDVVIEKVEGTAGMYSGVDEASGNKYVIVKKGFKGSTEFTVMRGNETIATLKKEGNKVPKMADAHAVVAEDSKKSAGYTWKRRNKGDKDYRSERTQVGVFDSKGNEVASFRSNAEAKAYIKSVKSGKKETTGFHVTDEEAAAHLKAMKDGKLEVFEEEDLTESDNDTKSEKALKEWKKTKTTTFSDEQKAALIAEYNARLNDFNLFKDPESALGPFIYEEMTLLEALNESVDLASEEHGAVLGMLLHVIPDEKLSAVKVRPSIYAENPEANGSWYDAKSNTVFYSPGASPRAIAHEAVHAVTARELNQLSPSDPLRIRMNQAYNAFYKHIESKGLLTKEELKDTVGTKTERTANRAKYPTDIQRLMYAVGSMEEFFSMALTDPQIRALSKEIKIPKVDQSNGELTVWQKLKGVIHEMIGVVKGTNEYTLLEEMLELTVGIGQVAVDDSRVMDFMYGEFNVEEQAQRAKELARKPPTFLENVSAKTKRAWMTLYRQGFRGIQNTLNDISPTLGNLIIDYGSRTQMLTNERAEKIKPWVEGFKRKVMGNADFNMYKVYMLNYHNETARNGMKKLHEKYPELGKFEDILEVLNDITEGMIATGQITKGRKHYFPNKVRDLDSLMRLMAKDMKGTIMAEAIADLKHRNKNGTFDQKELEQVMMQYLQRGAYPAMIRRPGSTKTKAIYEITEEMSQFFEDPADVLIKHIVENTKKTEQHKLIGSSNRAALEVEIEKLLDKPAGSLTAAQEKRLGEAREALASIHLEQESSISKWITKNAMEGTVEPDHQKLIVDSLQAHFNEDPMNPIFAFFRTAGTIGVLGSLTSTVIQVQDTAATLVEAGLPNAVEALVKAMKKNALHTKADVMENNIMEQLGKKGAMSKILEVELFASGFSYLDSLFKTVAMEAQILKASKMSLDEFSKKYGDIYNAKGEAQQLHKDLRNRVKNPATARFALNKLAKIQPVNTLSMPPFYAKHPNARIVYTLQSFAVKQFNNGIDYYKEGQREGFAGIEAGNRAGAAKLATYVAVLVALGAPAGCVQQLLVGKDCDLGAEILDTLLQLFFVSRYSVAEMAKGGIIEWIGEAFVPPTGWIKKPITDIYNLARDDRDATWSFATELPVIQGKIIHGWFSQEAKKKNLRTDRERIFGLYESMAEKGATDKDRAKLREWVTSYNKEAVTMDVNRITRETLQRSIKRKATRKAEKESKVGGGLKMSTGAGKILAGIGEAIGPSKAYAGKAPKDKEMTVDKKGTQRRFKALVVGKAAERLGVDYDIATKNLNKFAELVGQAENSGRVQGDNKTSSATGLYQFLDDSIEPAMNRLARITGWRPWMKEAIEAGSMNSLSREEQTLVFLANIMETEGTDPLVKKVMKGDVEAMKQLYSKYHHTNPDAATEKLIEKIFKS